MTKPLRNRLGGQMNDPVGTGLPSLWIVGELSSGTMLVNSFDASPGEVLTTTDGGRWSVVLAGSERQQWHGRVPAREHLPSHEALGLHELRGQLEGVGTSWGGWREVTPLVPGIDQKTELRELDLTIQDHIGAVSVVAHRPKVSLEVEVERVPVAVARKVPPRAPSYLAAHTEDWQRLTLRGIVPKRILAEVRRDDMSMYENRVAVSLIDNLTRYLDERIEQVNRALGLLGRVQDIGAAVSGTFQRQYRVYSLWGESMDARTLGSSARETLQALERIRYEVVGLKDTVLYRELRGTSPIGASLRSTNLLTHDQHYRRVAELWRHWAKRTAGADSLTPRQRHEMQQEVIRSFEWFCVLLVIRALSQLGFEADDAAPIRERRSRVLLNAEQLQSDMSMVWTEDGTIDIVHEILGPMLRVLPLPQALAEAREHLDSRLAEVVEAQGLSSVPTLVLFPWSARGDGEIPGWGLLEDERLQTAGNDPRTRLPKGLSVMPVSTWDIDSTERVARVLRWCLWGTIVSDACMGVDLPEGTLASEFACDWLQPEDNHILVITRIPAPRDWKVSVFGAEFDRLDQETQAHDREVGRLQAEFSRARGAQKAGLNVALESEIRRRDKVAAQRDAILQAKRSIEAAVLRMEAVARCPICHTIIDTRSSLRVRSSGHYQAECHDCHATWGTRVCGHCTQHFPILMPGDFALDIDGLPGCVDRALGADVLAVPICVPGDSPKFVCPTCGMPS